MMKIGLKRACGVAMCGGLAAMLVATGAPAAPAPSVPEKAAPNAGGSEPEVTTATFQDWLVRCVTPPAAARACEATQTIQVQGQGQGQQGGTIAVIAVGRLAADGPLRIALQLPAGVWLPAGARLLLSEKATPVSLEFKRCLQGCFAEAEADKALEQNLRTASGTGSIQFEDGARRAVSVPLSFRGFIPSLEAALKLR